MTTKTKARPTAAAFREIEPLTDSWFASAYTTEDRLVRIQALSDKIDGHVAFMHKVDTLVGTSSEAKEKAVEVFYSSLLLMEQHLNRIRENLQLG
jgi:hypothetical protein